MTPFTTLCFLLPQSTLQDVDALLADGQMEQALERIDSAERVALASGDTSLQASIATMRANVYSQQVHAVRRVV